MGSFSVWHWLIVLAVVLVLFGGRGKISALMGDLGKGLNAFKKGVGAATDETAQTPPGPTPADAAKPIQAQTTTTPPGTSAGGPVHQDSAAKV